ncbi:MAG: MBL fold metallo-hydrolase, partial [Gammaproteobacteria bacterium]
GPYPAKLKKRVGGQFGHLSNAQAAELLMELDCGKLQHLVAAHLSEKNNTPQLARAALAQALDCELDWVQVATQDGGLGWHELR